MSQATVKAIPDGMHTLTAYLICSGASDAVAFYEKAFGAIEVSRAENKNGKIVNAQLRIGDSLLMLMDEFPNFSALGPKSLKGSPVTIHMRVTDVDDVFRRATSAGATVKVPIKDEFWGDRMGVLEDPFGHNWSVATHVRDVSPEEQREHAARAMNG